MDRRGRLRAVAAARLGGRMALAALVVAGLSACQPQTRHHGYAPDDAALAAIQVGRDDREAVASAIGRPGTMGVLRDGGWYYVGSRWEQIGWRAPVEVERELVAVSFDSRGIVSNIERFGLQDGEVVPLSRRVTESTVRQRSFFGQILGNVGRFQADQFID